jgi:hypothetical protein
MKPAITDETLNFWCNGKEAFASASLARKIAKASSGRHDAAITAYHCDDCGYWHTGGASKRKKPKMRIVRRR